MAFSVRVHERGDARSCEPAHEVPLRPVPVEHREQTPALAQELRLREVRVLIHLAPGASSPGLRPRFRRARDDELRERRRRVVVLEPVLERELARASAVAAVETRRAHRVGDLVLVRGGKRVDRGLLQDAADAADFRHLERLALRVDVALDDRQPALHRRRAAGGGVIAAGRARLRVRVVGRGAGARAAAHRAAH
eukprot:31476-Pelagococcus_subviridis.AAC.5